MLEAALLETLNMGSKEQLLALHGIGKKRAELILEVRWRVSQPSTPSHTTYLSPPPPTDARDATVHLPTGLGYGQGPPAQGARDAGGHEPAGVIVCGCGKRGLRVVVLCDCGQVG